MIEQIPSENLLSTIAKSPKRQNEPEKARGIYRDGSSDKSKKRK